MPSVFSYLNYRDFLRESYAERKRANPSFSYQVLATRAALKAKSFLASVVAGRKELSEKSVHGLARALDLSEREEQYLETLVQFARAHTHHQKNRLFARLMEDYRGTDPKTVVREQYELYSKWYHNTVRELVAILPFGDDYALLARQLTPPIPPRQARGSVELLLKLGLVRREASRYVQTDQNISTGATVRSLAVQNFHLQNLRLAAEAIDATPAAERDITCLVGSMSPATLERVKAETAAFRRKLVKIIGQDKSPDRVHHIAIQVFPTSKRIEEIAHVRQA